MPCQAPSRNHSPLFNPPLGRCWVVVLPSREISVQAEPLTRFRTIERTRFFTISARLAIVLWFSTARFRRSDFTRLALAEQLEARD
jgi:hypothetical protein